MAEGTRSPRYVSFLAFPWEARTVKTFIDRRSLVLVILSLRVSERFATAVDERNLCVNCQVQDLRAALGPLTGRSSEYETDACLKRYLRARSWNLKKAEKMLRETLQWRASYKPEEIRWVSLHALLIVQFWFYSAYTILGHLPSSLGIWNCLCWLNSWFTTDIYYHFGMNKMDNTSTESV